MEALKVPQVADAGVVTGGGVSLAIDATLYLIGRIYGEDAAAPPTVCYLRQLRKYMLVLSLTDFDPKRSFRDGALCSSVGPSGDTD